MPRRSVYVVIEHDAGNNHVAACLTGGDGLGTPGFSTQGPYIPTSAYLIALLKGTFILFFVTGRPEYLKGEVGGGK